MAKYGATEACLELKASSKEDEPQGFMEHAAPYVAEFVGTFLIVFTMGCCSICGDPMWNPTGVAFVVLAAVYSFGPISGAHLNPAVSLTLGFVLKFPWVKMLGYVLTQLAGGLLGSLTYWAVFSRTVPLGPPAKSNFEWYDVAMVEALYTFMLSFVFINCVAAGRNNREGDQNHFFALAVGFVYIAGGYPALDISGGIFNPAASLAIGLTSAASASAALWQLHWTAVYIAAQVAGAWLASLVFAIVRPEDFKLQYDGSLEDFEVPLRAKQTSEFVGTFLVVLTVGLNLIMVSPAVPWSSAASYTCLIYSLGDVSGGHFNPAVTFAAMLSRRGHCSIALGQSYIVNQLLAGLCAGIVYVHFDINSGKMKSIPLEPQEGFSWGQAGMAEVLFTALLAFVFLAVSTTTMPPSTTKTNFYFGLTVGSCMCVGGFAIGAISGGVLNPAVGFGRSVAQVISLAALNNAAKDYSKLLNCVYYALFELLGSVVAAFMFFLTHQREYLKDGSGYPHIP